MSTGAPPAPPVHGRAALVTGASGRMGEAFARALAARGFLLVLVARHGDRLNRQARHLSAEFGVEVEPLVADLLEPESIGRVETRLADIRRPIDLLVNNAGSTPRPALFADQAPAEEQQRIALHVMAAVRLTRAALPQMLARRHGGILNVSSVSAFLPQPQGSVYAASKAFLTSFSESLHCEVRRQGVHVTALCPGFIRADAPGPQTGPQRVRLSKASFLERDDVVDAGLDAIARGRAVCVPGSRYRALLLAARLLPRELVQRGFEHLWAAPRPAGAPEQRPSWAGAR
jgi:uncharacterized protein